MKKIFVVFCMLLLTAAMTACSAGEQDVSLGNADGNDWGLTFGAKNVSSTGMILEVSQHGGENVNELTTGAPFSLEQRDGDSWEPVPFLSSEGDWTMEAWVVTLEGITEWNVNWEWLYGKLKPGDYRMVKEFVNFRGPGDSETRTMYIEFSVI